MYVCICIIVLYMYVQSVCRCISYYVVTQLATLYSKLCHLTHKILTNFSVLKEKET